MHKKSESIKSELMSRFIKKKKEDIGLSPYALVFRGQQKTEKTVINIIDFNIDEVEEYEVKNIEKLAEFKNSKSVTWLNIYGLHDVALMEQLALLFDIPVNIFSDIMNPSLRPKVQEFENGLYITLKMLRYPEDSPHIASDNLSLIVLEHVILSFQEQPTKTFEPIRDRIRKPKNKIRSAGTDYMAFALIDVVVDNYIYVLGILGEKIENLEETITENPGKDLIEQIDQYKKELNFLRKNVKPAKEMILTLVKLESDMIVRQNRMHYKELQDNINEASELADSYREILYDQMTIYHTMMSTKLNDIMRTLTVFSVVFIPLTFIVGIYGTNFDVLPEIHWRYGYLAMWILMIGVALLMLWYFRRKKWF
jgi:magnesium transporter